MDIVSLVIFGYQTSTSTTTLSSFQPNNPKLSWQRTEPHLPPFQHLTSFQICHLRCVRRWVHADCSAKDRPSIPCLFHSRHTHSNVSKTGPHLLGAMCHVHTHFSLTHTHTHTLLFTDQPIALLEALSNCPLPLKREHL